MTPSPARFLLLGALCTLLVACDSSSNADTEIAPGTMRAQIGGTAWKAASATANRLTMGGSTTLTITGATLQAEAVSFTLTDTGTGTYTLDDTFTPAGPDVLSASYTKAPGQTYVATGGTFEITRQDDDGIEGSFRFEARNQQGQTVSVTAGAFNVGYGPAIGKQ